MIEISTLAPTEEDHYVEWLRAIDESAIYYTPSFHRFLAAAVGGEPQVLIARRGCELVGALPFLQRKHPKLGAVFNSLPWYGSHGGCVLSSTERGVVRRELVVAYRQCIATSDLLSSTVILSSGETASESEYRAVLQTDADDYRIGQITALPEFDSSIHAKLEVTLRQKTRNLVRKACRQGFEEVVSDDDWAWQFLFNTHQENIVALGGRHKPWEHFLELRRHIPAEQRRLSVALHSAKPVAALLILVWNRTVEYLTPVICHDYRSLQPLSFLIWRGMIDAARQGCRWWNWGGTWASQTSLHHFKAGWGATDQPYRYLVSVAKSRTRELRACWSDITAAWPYYYIYPISELQRDLPQ
jgi:Acetyltransferase (GNAT) domain